MFAGISKYVVGGGPRVEYVAEAGGVATYLEDLFVHLGSALEYLEGGRGMSDDGDGWVEHRQLHTVQGWCGLLAMGRGF